MRALGVRNARAVIGGRTAVPMRVGVKITIGILPAPAPRFRRSSGRIKEFGNKA